MNELKFNSVINNEARPSFAENLKEHQIPLIRSSLKGKQLTLVCLVYAHNNVASAVFHTFVPPCFNYLHGRNGVNLAVLAVIVLRSIFSVTIFKHYHLQLIAGTLPSFSMY